jgi:hypothetical protein
MFTLEKRITSKILLQSFLFRKISMHECRVPKCFFPGIFPSKEDLFGLICEWAEEGKEDLHFLQAVSTEQTRQGFV